MIEIKTKLGMDAGNAQAQLKLPFDLRQKSRLRTQLVNGEDAWLLLPRGDILRGGDKLLANDGTTALHGFHIKALNLVPIAPASTDGLSGPWEITTDTMNSAGVVRVTTRNQAFAAADVIGVCKVDLEISPEAAQV